MVPWALKNGGKTVFSMPRVAVFRSFIMNHAIHHRGQLSVYLRLCDVPLPAIYGPTADTQELRAVCRYEAQSKRKRIWVRNEFVAAVALLR